MFATAGVVSLVVVVRERADTGVRGVAARRAGRERARDRRAAIMRRDGGERYETIRWNKNGEKRCGKEGRRGGERL
jgi:hypothetical protein